VRTVLVSQINLKNTGPRAGNIHKLLFGKGQIYNDAFSSWAISENVEISRERFKEL